MTRPVPVTATVVVRDVGALMVAAAVPVAPATAHFTVPPAGTDPAIVKVRGDAVAADWLTPASGRRLTLVRRAFRL